ncbi:unnamed protein product [Pedinophyceae sp. YPF-701]|nr:unnamed protein product [Pedinophyceae sp. YPF-701]
MSCRAQLTIGVDVGTQSVKAVVYDVDSRAVVARGSSDPLDVATDGVPGRAEQRPEDWMVALKQAVGRACEGVDAAQVGAFGVSGQQHGLVVLGADKAVLRPAKLWCDVEAAKEAEELSREFGWPLLASFTAPKLLWLKHAEPETYASVRHVLLPHDWVNFRLTGELAMECGDASGTGLLDINTRSWNQAWLDVIDPRLSSWLPAVSDGGDAPIGKLRPDMAEYLGLPTGIAVSKGSGDNMCSALGVGAVEEGRWVCSLGTSGTVFGFSNALDIDQTGAVAPFCDCTGGYLPLLCTLNCTGPVNEICSLTGKSHEELAQEALAAPVGKLLMLPYFVGERTPNWPGSTGALLGITPGSLTPGGLYRAAIEGATLSLLSGLGRLKEASRSDITELIAVGGGARSDLWCQTLADAFGVPVVAPAEPEAAAFGAALQAAAALLGAETRSYVREVTSAAEGGRRFVPDAAKKALYEDALQRFEKSGAKLFA